MMNLLRAALIALAAGPPALAAVMRHPEETLLPQKESWHTLSMEAKAIMGELKYQQGDLSGARDTFKDSLDSSTKLLAPQGSVMGLDLYRSAELAARRGDARTAREHLEILINRYPDSDWAEKGKHLLLLLPRARSAASPEDEPEAPAIAADEPEFALARIKSALTEGSPEDALAECRDFSRRYPSHAAAGEVRLLAGALHLKLGAPAQAARVLKPLAGAASGTLRSKALHLLGAAYLSLGDHEGVREAVPGHTRPGADKWQVLAQIWRAASEDRQGLRDSAMARYRGVTLSRHESPLKAYARAALGADLDRQGLAREALASLQAAAREAGRFGLAELGAVAELSQAHLLARLRRLDAAARQYSEFARRHPGHPQRALALYQRGLVLKRLGRGQEAVAAFAEVVSKSPDSVYAPDAHLQLGQLYAETGQSEKAISHYRSLGRGGVQSREKESVLLIAQVHYNAKRYREAIPLYRQFLEAQPGDPRAHEVEELLLTSYWLGDRRDPGLVEAVLKYPNHPIVSHIRWELGAAAYKEGDYRKAADLFSRYASDFPTAKNAPENLFYLGQSLAKAGNPRGAAGAYRRLITLYPGHPRRRQAALKLGAALYQEGDYEAAAGAFQEAEGADDPTSADALYNRGVVLGKAGKKTAALAVYERLLTRFPGHPMASWVWFQIGTIRESLGRLNPALMAYSRVSPLDDNRVSALFSIARINEKLKQTDKAVAAYEQLQAARPAADPVRLRGLLRLGILHELGNHPMKAMNLYAEIMRLGSRGGPDSEAARKRVESITREVSAVAR